MIPLKVTACHSSNLEAVAFRNSVAVYDIGSQLYYERVDSIEGASKGTALYSIAIQKQMAVSAGSCGLMNVYSCEYYTSAVATLDIGGGGGGMFSSSSAAVYMAHASYDGTRIVCCTHDGRVCVFQGATKKQLPLVQAKVPDSDGLPVMVVKWSPADSTIFFSAGQSNNVTVWQLSGLTERVVKLAPVAVFPTNANTASSISTAVLAGDWSGDGDFIFLAVGPKLVAAHCHLGTQQQQQQQHHAVISTVPHGHSDIVFSLSVAPSKIMPTGMRHSKSHIIVTASKDCTLRVFLFSLTATAYVLDGRFLSELRGHTGPVRGVSIAPTLPFRCASVGNDGATITWQLPSEMFSNGGEKARTIVVPSQPVTTAQWKAPATSCAWSGDGKALLTTTLDGFIVFTNIVVGKLVLPREVIPGLKQIKGVSFSAAGDSVTVVGEKDQRITLQIKEKIDANRQRERLRAEMEEELKKTTPVAPPPAAAARKAMTTTTTAADPKRMMPQQQQQPASAATATTKDNGAAVAALLQQLGGKEAQVSADDDDVADWLAANNEPLKQPELEPTNNSKEEAIAEGGEDYENRLNRAFGEFSYEEEAAQEQIADEGEGYVAEEAEEAEAEEGGYDDDGDESHDDTGQEDGEDAGIVASESSSNHFAAGGGGYGAKTRRRFAFAAKGAAGGCDDELEVEVDVVKHDVDDEDPSSSRNSKSQQLSPNSNNSSSSHGKKQIGVAGLTPAQVAKLREQFAEFDLDHSNFLSYSEAMGAMMSYYPSGSPTEMIETIKRLDTNCDQKLSFEEWATLAREFLDDD